MKEPCVYILCNVNNSVFYTGVTSNLAQRIYQHKNNVINGFSSRYNCKFLRYYEVFDDMENAILREKQIKSYRRSKKIELIEALNPNWDDLAIELFGLF